MQNSNFTTLGKTHEKNLFGATTDFGHTSFTGGAGSRSLSPTLNPLDDNEKERTNNKLQPGYQKRIALALKTQS